MKFTEKVIELGIEIRLVEYVYCLPLREYTSDRMDDNADRPDPLAQLVRVCCQSSKAGHQIGMPIQLLGVRPSSRI